MSLWKSKTSVRTLRKIFGSNYEMVFESRRGHTAQIQDLDREETVELIVSILDQDNNKSSIEVCAAVEHDIGSGVGVWLCTHTFTTDELTRFLQHSSLREYHPEDE